MMYSIKETKTSDKDFFIMKQANVVKELKVSAN